LGGRSKSLSAEIAGKIAQSGPGIVPMSPQEFGAMVRQDCERYGRLTRAAGVTAD
jgi:tripartite-type tricarboxylate transporter receptor subunit TctC